MSVAQQEVQLLNYVGGAWTRSSAREHAPVHNPATGEVIARVPLSAARDVAEAVQAAAAAFPDWRDTPVGERVQHLGRVKGLPGENREHAGRTIGSECG